eukprot:TRINITY_DN21764_c0_g2_i1.p1 TRINITY_DN21764_c0_g2~~TRINITY_DN21764_c0_g2_i1.p1  ORF type:complete len:278 (-),score=34.66 TRINITY_DN21764_c0_g2_i1:227-1060(-)
MAYFWNSHPLRTLEFQRARAARDEATAVGVAEHGSGNRNMDGAGACSAELPATADGGPQRRRRRAGGALGGSSSAPALPSCRPASPSTWLGELRKTAMKPLEVGSNTENHRHYWFHPRTSEYPLGKTEPATGRGPEAKENRRSSTGIGLRSRELGSYQTDYAQAEKGVQHYMQLRDIQGDRTQSLMFYTSLKRRGLNPSLASEGVVGCSTGGSTVSLRHSLNPEMRKLLRPDKRCVGLYEDSFLDWEGRRPGKHGLKTSDVTQFADAAVQQKCLMRT